MNEKYIELNITSTKITTKNSKIEKNIYEIQEKQRNTKVTARE